MSETVEQIIEAAPVARVLEIARARWAMGMGVRGLPRPEGHPVGGWYHVQKRKLKGGSTAVYLSYRYYLEARPAAKNLGRLN